MVEEVDRLASEAGRKDFEEDLLKVCLNESIMNIEEAETEEVKEMVRALDDLSMSNETTKIDLKEGEIEENKQEEKHLKLELKQLPSHLWYAFLDEKKRYPLIVNASLTQL